MNTYQISFHGRLKGAIGITYTVIEDVTAVSEDAAVLRLYNKYENVLWHKVRLLKQCDDEEN
jgi:hypothetical protein